MVTLIHTSDLVYRSSAPFVRWYVEPTYPNTPTPEGRYTLTINGVTTTVENGTVVSDLAIQGDGSERVDLGIQMDLPDLFG